MNKTLQPVHLFLLHVAKNLTIGATLIGIALGIGMVGYHYYEHMPWVDAFCNAAMILSGMGPVVPLTTYGGKMFAGFYALFSGLTFIAIIGIIFAPIFKRFFHKLHIDE
ncbi:MAG: hypothetical protein V4501_10060 [Pseudomonadota bacterium]